MNETIIRPPTAAQGENKGKGNPSPWTRVSTDHLVKTAEKLNQYAVKKKAEKAAEKKKVK